MQSVGGLGAPRNTPGGNSRAQSGSVSGSVSQLLNQQPSLKGVLSELGYAPKDVRTIQTQKGVPDTLQMTQVFIKELSQSAQQSLKLLGLDSTVIAMISNSNSSELLKKRFKKISDDLYNRELLEELSENLGVTIPEDTILFGDNKGVVLLLQSGLNEIDLDYQQELDKQEVE